ncbi:MAG: hypothetical protein FGM52_12275 [Mycobacterium sp.]|nr:hypothetical protein [Mycobacterium sp.]
MIFSLGRSGSHLLADLLNAQTTIHCDDELFNVDRWQSQIRRRLLPVYRRYPMWYVSYRQQAIRDRPSISGYGFMLKLGEIDGPAKFFRKLHDADWHILHLQRQSVFAQTVSHFVARQSGRWNSRLDDPDPEFGRFTVAPEDFLQLFKNKQRRIRECHDLIGNLPHLTLTYEQDLQSSDQWQGTVARVCDYLRLETPSLPAVSTLRTTWRQPYRELIDNYDELLEVARQQGESV